MGPGVGLHALLQGTGSSPEKQPRCLGHSEELAGLLRRIGTSLWGALLRNEITAPNAFHAPSPHTSHELCILCPSSLFSIRTSVTRKHTVLSPGTELLALRAPYYLLQMKGCWPGRLGRRNQSWYQGVPPVTKPNLSHSALRRWIYCPSPSSPSYFLSSRAWRREFSLSPEELPSSLRGSGFFIHKSSYLLRWVNQHVLKLVITFPKRKH